MNTAKINDNLFAVQNDPHVVVAYKFVFEITDIITQFKFDVIAHTEVMIMILIISPRLFIDFFAPLIVISISGKIFYIIQREKAISGFIIIGMMQKSAFSGIIKTIDQMIMIAVLIEHEFVIGEDVFAGYDGVIALCGGLFIIFQGGKEAGIIKL